MSVSWSPYYSFHQLNPTVFRVNPSWGIEQVDSGPGQWNIITGFLDISWVVSVLDLQCKFFGPCPKKEKQNKFPFGEVNSSLSVRCSGRLGRCVCLLLCSCCVTLSCCTLALIRLAVILRNVKGFHLEGAASPGRGKRVCYTLAVGTLVQLKKVIWIQVMHQPLVLWEFCGQVYVGLECIEQVSAVWGFHCSVKCNA